MKVIDYRHMEQRQTWSFGARTSSILRIIRTTCVARSICCFFDSNVSMTCWSFISATKLPVINYCNLLHTLMQRNKANCEKVRISTCKHFLSKSEWMCRGLMYHSTLYRSFQGRFLQARWPNQQRQVTEGSQSDTDKLKSHQNHSTVLQYEIRQPLLG